VIYESVGSVTTTA